MFRDDLQVARCCKQLCRRLEGFKGELWKANPNDYGPTKLALKHRERSPWSSGERALLRATFALWNPSNQCDLGDLLCSLDSEALSAIGLLLVSIANGPDAVDEWLETERQLDELDVAELEPAGGAR